MSDFDMPSGRLFDWPWCPGSGTEGTPPMTGVYRCQVCGRDVTLFERDGVWIVPTHLHLQRARIVAERVADELVAFTQQIALDDMAARRPGPPQRGPSRAGIARGMAEAMRELMRLQIEEGDTL